MTKIIKPLRIAIDLQSLFAKTLPDDISSLLKRKSCVGALGGVTLFSEVFDLYVLSKYTNLNTDEIMRWLKAGQIDHCFRNIVVVDENLHNFYLQNNISITIISNYTLINLIKDISKIYWLQDIHTLDIHDGIEKVTAWKDIIRDITKYSTSEQYDYKFIKK